MKKIIFVLLLVLSASGLFAEEITKGQTFQFNEAANEEIIIINNTKNTDAFKIYIHTTDATSFHFGAFSASVVNSGEGWMYLTKTPEIKGKSKWKSSSDFELLEHSDLITIETKSGNKYSYNFETKHDKLYITVTDFIEGDDW